MSMTDEQIKQYAKNSVEAVCMQVGPLLSILPKAAIEPLKDLLRYCIEKGAHSRDEEIKELEQALAFTEDVVDTQKKELDKLRNPWISVEERLPEQERDEDGNKIGMSVEVFIRTEFVDNNHTYVHYGRSRCYFKSDGGHEWQTPDVTHWMPIPDIH